MVLLVLGGKVSPSSPILSLMTCLLELLGSGECGMLALKQCLCGHPGNFGKK